MGHCSLFGVALQDQDPTGIGPSGITNKLYPLFSIYSKNNKGDGVGLEGTIFERHFERKNIICLYFVDNQMKLCYFSGS